MIDILTRQLEVSESAANSGPKNVISINIPKGEETVPVSALESLTESVNKIQNELEIRTNEISGGAYLASQTI